MESADNWIEEIQGENFHFRIKQAAGGNYVVEVESETNLVYFQSPDTYDEALELIKKIDADPHYLDPEPDDLDYPEQITLPDGKTLADVIFDESAMLLKNPVKDEAAAARYRDAVRILKEEQKKGKFQLEYADEAKPYSLHCIYLHWNMEDGEDMDYDNPGPLGSAIKNVSGLFFSKGDDTWQLSIQIYHEANE